MKKKLEAELMSIAHRVLQMKNKSDVNQLFNETQKLYEKLSVLRFVEEHFEGPKPTIGQAEIVEKMKHFFEEIHISDPLISTTPKAIVVEEEVENEIVLEQSVLEDEILIEEIIEEVIVMDEVPEEVVIDKEEESEIVAEELIETEESKDFGFLPAFELDQDDEEEVDVEEEDKVAETPNKPEVQISFMDLLGSDYSEPMFVKVDQSEEVKSKVVFSLPKETSFQLDKEDVETVKEEAAKRTVLKSVSLNDKFAKGITVGLNDRIAFVKHLFGNSDEDYNRVMNQLITYDNFEEAQSFIDDMVKPDYNNWVGKDDYSQRFIEIIEKKFT